MRRHPSFVTAAILLVAALAACTTTTTTSSDIDEPEIDQDLLREPGLAARAVTALGRSIGSENPKASDATVYPEYFLVEAQNPTNLEHIDRYEWRDGEVGVPTPVHLSGPQEDVEASLYPLRSVHWEDLPAMVKDAERAAEGATPIGIEDARAGYVIVDRTTVSDGDSQVIVRIYLEGPRRSGYAELTSTGEIISVNVS